MAEKRYTTAVLITGDSTGAQKAIKLTQDQLDALTKKTEESGRSWKAWAESAASAGATAAKWAAGAVAAGAAVGAAMVKSAVDSAEATGILAQKLGITTEALSKLQYAAKLSDVEQSKLEAGLKRLTRTLTEAESGTGKAADAFAQLGLSAEKLLELPADQQLGAIADALNAVDNASRKAALAQDIFGKAGVDLIPILTEGSAGIKALGDEAERFGVVISGDLAQKSQQFNDNLDKLKFAVQGLGLSLAEEAIGPMTQFTDEIVRLAQDKESMDAIIEGITNIGKAAKITAQIIAGLAGDINDAFTRDLGEVTAEIVAVSRELEALQRIEDRGGSIDQRQRQYWQDKLDALQKERAELKNLVVQRQFDNVEAGKSTGIAKQETAARTDTTRVIRQQAVATQEAAKARWDYREANMEAIFAEENATEATEKHTVAIKAQKAESDPWAEAMTGAVERIDAAFADAWRNIDDGWGGLLDGMKDALSQWLAEMAHLLITKPLLVSLSAGLTGGGGASSLISGGGLLSKIPGIGGAFSPGGMAPFLGEWGVRSGVLKQSYGAGGMGPPQTSFSLTGAAANIGAGVAGSYLASSLYGGRESTGYGAMAGGVAGSWFGPVGTFVGSAVGEALDRALSGSDFSGKRVKLGVITGSGAAGNENVRTLASGLQIGNITRRAGDAGLSDEQINTYLGAFDVLDAGLTAIARGAGLNVNLAGTTLAGPRSAYDGGLTPEGFFGSMAKGELRGSLQDAPAEFVKAWLAEIDDQLSARTKSLLGDTAGKTAEQLVTIFGFAADLDRLLSIDVIAQAKDSAEAASKTILDAYDAATASVVDLAQQYDGTTDSLGNLTNALAAQKDVAAVLAQQYQALEAQITGTFGSAIDYIKESVLSEEELYARRREQIAAITGGLATATDPAAIAAGISQIDRLSRDAFGMLTPEQQQAMAAEFVSFLEQAQALAQSRVDAGQESLSAREQAVQEAINLEIMQGAAQVQEAAATTFAGAVAQFQATVAQLQLGEVNV